MERKPRCLVLELAMSNSEQKLPLDGWHRAHGGRMVPFAGYAMPVQYEGIMAEHLWTRQSAGLFDVSHMGQLLIAGPEAEKGLESLLPADLASLGEGRLRYSLLLNVDGGIVDDLMVTRRGDHFYMVVNGATKHGDIDYLQDKLPKSVVLDHMREQALLALQGPRAVEALARLAPGVEALGFMTGGGFALGGVRAWISRSGYTGEDGFEISIPARDAENVASLLAAQPEVKPIGLGARDSLRLEAGLPLYGHDLDTATTPIEAGLAFAVSKVRRAGGGFPGLAPDYAGAGRRADPQARRPAVEGRQPVREGAMVVDDEAMRSARSPRAASRRASRRRSPWPMCRSPRPRPGRRCRSPPAASCSARTVTPMPFVPHRYHRKGGPQ